MATEATEEFFNPYHGPDGRFTSAGGAKLRGTLSSMKRDRHGVRVNAAQAGHAKRKGDAASAKRDSHAAKVAKGRADSAQGKVRAMRAAQIAAAKRKLGKTGMNRYKAFQEVKKDYGVKIAAMNRQVTGKRRARTASAAEGTEEFFNPYHGPDGRFTSGGGAKLRGTLASMKRDRHGVRVNAAQAGRALGRDDAVGRKRDLHAAKIARGRANAAQSRIRAMRAAQIAMAKRQSAKNAAAKPQRRRKAAAPKG